MPRVARVIAEGTAAASAEVWLRLGDELRLTAAWPVAGEHAALAIGDGALPIEADRVAAVRHHGELLGAIAVHKRVSEPLTHGEAELVDRLADQAGLILANARLTADLEARLDQIAVQAAELRASRQRIVTAQDEERRRLERNIHDGAQQHLVALAVKLRLAKTAVAADPARGRTMLDELGGEIDDALDTLRALALGIYPPLLEEQGIAPALAAQYVRSGLPVRMDADATGRYPIEIEAAVYFAALEALQNAAKYANAGEIAIAIQPADGELRFSVRDDGVGFDPAHDRSRQRSGGHPRPAGGLRRRRDGRVRAGQGHRRARTRADLGGARAMRRTLAIAIPIASTALLIAGVALERSPGDLMWVPLVVASTGVGALLWYRRAGRALGPLFAFVGASIALDIALSGYVHQSSISSLPGAAWVAWLFQSAIGLSGAIYLILQLFPTGHPLTPRWRALVWITLATMGLSIIAPALGRHLGLHAELPAGHPPDAAGLPVDWPTRLTSIGGLAGVVVLLASARRDRAAVPALHGGRTRADEMVHRGRRGGGGRGRARRVPPAAARRSLRAADAVDPDRRGDRDLALPPVRHRSRAVEDARVRAARRVHHGRVRARRGGDRLDHRRLVAPRDGDRRGAVPARRASGSGTSRTGSSSANARRPTR